MALGFIESSSLLIGSQLNRMAINTPLICTVIPSFYMREIQVSDYTNKMRKPRDTVTTASIPGPRLKPFLRFRFRNCYERFSYKKRAGTEYGREKKQVQNTDTKKAE